jgi:hypothetical protein
MASTGNEPCCALLHGFGQRLLINFNATANGPENKKWQGIPLPNCLFF